MDKNQPPSIIIFLDESGDLGWSFTKPYRNGGSSRYLTLASLIVPPNLAHLPKRVITKLSKKYHWSPKQEKKWADMTGVERSEFAERALRLIEEHPLDIRYLSITVRKEKVEPHIRDDANKLYNYMIKLLLLHEMSQHPSVLFTPDPRSIKVESGNSLHDYLQTELWFNKVVTTKLTTKPMDSASNSNVQFADMLSGIVQGHFEDGNSSPWKILSHRISYKTLFF